MNICFFGGTFNPVHVGHQLILDDLLTKGFDKIIIIPTGDVNYKTISVNKHDRLEMVKIWIDSYKNSSLEVDDFEVNHVLTSNTVTTLKYLQEKYQGSKITMALGYDSYEDLANWEESDYLKDNLEFIVYNRDGQTAYEGQLIDISSTALRAYFNPHLVPEVILNYIVTKQIYNLQPFIVNYEEVNEDINEEEEIIKRTSFIKETLLKSGLKNLVLGISGGQDSTLAAMLALKAIKELGADYQLHLVRLPYGKQADEDDCQLVLNWLGQGEVHTFNIKECTDICASAFAGISDFNKGNIKARVRMLYQYTLASEIKALVIGTDHSAENITGFFTKHGDGASDLNPLFGLNKRQGRALLKYLGAPAKLYEKTPTADLEDDKPQLPDEERLGVTYQQIDDYLEGKEVPREAKVRIEQLFIQNMHKRMVNNYSNKLKIIK